MPTPTAAELKQRDRTRQGKRVRTAEWVSPSDPDARIARLKDGRTRLAYESEHAVDLDAEAGVAATIPACRPRRHTTSLAGTLDAAARGLDAAGCAPSTAAPTELVADKGYS